jgi:hypothetical protein
MGWIIVDMKKDWKKVFPGHWNSEKSNDCQDKVEEKP